MLITAPNPVILFPRFGSWWRLPRWLECFYEGKLQIDNNGRLNGHANGKAIVNGAEELGCCCTCARPEDGVTVYAIDGYSDSFFTTCAACANSALTPWDGTFTRWDSTSNSWTATGVYNGGSALGLRSINGKRMYAPLGEGGTQSSILRDNVPTVRFSGEPASCWHLTVICHVSGSTGQTHFIGYKIGGSTPAGLYTRVQATCPDGNTTLTIV